MDPPSVIGAGLGIALMVSSAAANLAAVGAWVHVASRLISHRGVRSDHLGAAAGWSIIALLSLFGFLAGLWLTVMSLYTFQDVR